SARPRLDTGAGHTSRYRALHPDRTVDSARPRFAAYSSRVTHPGAYPRARSRSATRYCASPAGSATASGSAPWRVRVRASLAASRPRRAAYSARVAILVSGDGMVVAFLVAFRVFPAPNPGGSRGV